MRDWQIVSYLCPDAMARGLEIGTKREMSARRNGRKQVNGADFSSDQSLRIHRRAACGELAVKIWLNCPDEEWNAYEDNVSGRADLAGFIDVKCPLDDRKNLIVPANRLHSSWAYVLVLADKRPFFRIRGWAWGREIVTVKELRRGRPAYIILQKDLRHPDELKAEYERRKAAKANSKA